MTVEHGRDGASHLPGVSAAESYLLAAAAEAPYLLAAAGRSYLPGVVAAGAS